MIKTHQFTLKAIGNYSIIMIRRAFALVARHLPYISKRVALFTVLYAQQRDVRVGGISCAALQDGRRWLIEKI